MYCVLSSVYCVYCELHGKLGFGSLDEKALAADPSQLNTQAGLHWETTPPRPVHPDEEKDEDLDDDSDDNLDEEQDEDLDEEQNVVRDDDLDVHPDEIQNEDQYDGQDKDRDDGKEGSEDFAS